jgi:hypothetical protein
MQAIEVDFPADRSEVPSVAPSVSSDAEDIPVNESESTKAEAEVATPQHVRSPILSTSEDVLSEQPSSSHRNSSEPTTQVSEPTFQVSLPPESSYAAKKQSSWRRRLFIVMQATVFAAPLAIFTFYYLQQALVSEHPKLGLLFLDPSATLTLVSVLTESLATVLPLILTYLFDLFLLQRKQRDDFESPPNGAPSEVSRSLLRRLYAGYVDGTLFFDSWQR